jgi:hypothetical protein
VPGKRGRNWRKKDDRCSHVENFAGMSGCDYVIRAIHATLPPGGCVSYRLAATYWLQEGDNDSSDITLMREPDGAEM